VLPSYLSTLAVTRIYPPVARHRTGGDGAGLSSSPRNAHFVECFHAAVIGSPGPMTSARRELAAHVRGVEVSHIFSNFRI